MITFAQLELKNFKIEKNAFIIHQEQQNKLQVCSYIPGKTVKVLI